MNAFIYGDEVDVVFVLLSLLPTAHVDSSLRNGVSIASRLSQNKGRYSDFMSAICNFELNMLTVDS